MSQSLPSRNARSVSNHLTTDNQLALHAGVEDDTPAMNQAILEGVQHDIERHRALAALTSASARPTPENAAAHEETVQAADELTQEAAAHLAQRAAEQMAAAPAPMPTRRSFPVSAPVSRDVPMASGGSASQNKTLSPEERLIARNSFSNPNMTNAQKELLYLRNRQKLNRMRADGSYSERRD
jgi:hypothetical protein